jgi:hypothetical protein
MSQQSEQQEQSHEWTSETSNYWELCRKDGNYYLKFLGGVSGMYHPSQADDEVCAGLLRLSAEVARLRTALERIERLEVTGPSPIGPLHGAGMAGAFSITTEIAREALKEQG